MHAIMIGNLRIAYEQAGDGPPLVLLLLERDARDLGLELGFREVRHRILDHRVPAQERQRGAEVLVDELGPEAHLVTAIGIGGLERQSRKRVVDVFVDERRFVEHAIVVHQHGHLAERIDLHEPGFVLLEIHQ